jgi:hypothetical protein
MENIYDNEREQSLGPQSAQYSVLNRNAPYGGPEWTNSHQNTMRLKGSWIGKTSYLISGSLADHGGYVTRREMQSRPNVFRT